MTPDRIREIEERVRKATLGPWKADEDESNVIRIWPAGPSLYFLADITLEADADFIAHAREDIPDLLAEVKRRGELLERALETIGVACDCPSCAIVHADIRKALHKEGG